MGSRVFTMRRAIALFTLIALGSAGVSRGAASPRRRVTDTLLLDNGVDAGDWGSIEYCEDGSFATALEIKFEPYSLIDTDETAVNAVRLYCSTLDHILTGYIQSVEGKHMGLLGNV
nr:vitelline membrane outer layer protein 1 homolog [Penaeus vannamei]